MTVQETRDEIAAESERDNDLTRLLRSGLTAGASVWRLVRMGASIADSCIAEAREAERLGRPVSSASRDRSESPFNARVFEERSASGDGETAVVAEASAKVSFDPAPEADGDCREQGEAQRIRVFASDSDDSRPEDAQRIEVVVFDDDEPASRPKQRSSARPSSSSKKKSASAAKTRSSDEKAQKIEVVARKNGSRLKSRSTDDKVHKIEIVEHKSNSRPSATVSRAKPASAPRPKKKEPPKPAAASLHSPRVLRRKAQVVETAKVLVPPAELGVEEPPKTSRPKPRSGEEIPVFVTDSGKKYHEKDCPVAHNTHQITLAEARRDGLEPCLTCHKPQAEG
jgi:hypothetical protein